MNIAPVQNVTRAVAQSPCDRVHGQHNDFAPATSSAKILANTVRAACCDGPIRTANCPCGLSPPAGHSRKRASIRRIRSHGSGVSGRRPDRDRAKRRNLLNHQFGNRACSVQSQLRPRKQQPQAARPQDRIALFRHADADARRPCDPADAIPDRSARVFDRLRRSGDRNHHPQLRPARVRSHVQSWRPVGCGARLRRRNSCVRNSGRCCPDIGQVISARWSSAHYPIVSGI